MESKYKVFGNISLALIFIVLIGFDVQLSDENEPIINPNFDDEACAWCGDDNFICIYTEEWYKLGDQLVITPPDE